MKDTLIRALKLSGRAILEYYKRPLEARQKESQSSVVTQADFASNSLIIDTIRKRFPDHNILSEETGFTNLGSDFTWIIDPLDGTSNFAAGIPWFGVLVSIFRKNEPLMGGAYVPVTDTLYFAEKGKGVFRNDELLVMKKNAELKNSLVSFATDYTDNQMYLQKGLDIFRYLVISSRNIRSTNSLIDFINTAEGSFGACINLFTKVWDISVFVLIINEAGGIVRDLNLQPISFNINPDIMETNFPVVAGSAEILESLRQVLIS